MPGEDERIVEPMNRLGERLLFVATGNPAQEMCMAAHRGRVHAVMLAVGAEFDFLCGAKRQAPRWMMSTGLEWLFRLATEPRRLWKRYLKHHPRFLVLFALQLLGVSFGRARLSSGARRSIGSVPQSAIQLAMGHRSLAASRWLAIRPLLGRGAAQPSKLYTSGGQWRPLPQHNHLD